MRRLAVEAKIFLFSYCCTAHAGNLVAKDLALIEPFRTALRDGVAVAVPVTRSPRAGAILGGNHQQ